MGHWAQNESFTMAVPVLWPEPCRTWVRWTEEKQHRHGAVNLKDLERFWMEKMVSDLLSCVLQTHYRRKLRAVTLGQNNCGQHELEKAFISQWDFLPTFNCFTSMIGWNFVIFFEWKIKRINNADLFSQPPLLIFTKGANISGGHCIYTCVCVCTPHTYNDFTISVKYINTIFF